MVMSYFIPSPSTESRVIIVQHSQYSTGGGASFLVKNQGKVLLLYYYTSRENTLILLDESHVSRLLATCVSVGSLTAVTIQRISTRCQGDDALAPVAKVPFHDSLYC